MIRSNVHHTFESELKKVLSQYEEDPGEDEVDAGDDNVDVSVGLRYGLVVVT